MKNDHHLVDLCKVRAFSYNWDEDAFPSKDGNPQMILSIPQ